MSRFILQVNGLPEQTAELIEQVSELSAQIAIIYYGFRFWWPIIAVLIGIVAAALIATLSSYMKTKVRDGIVQGTEKAIADLDKLRKIENEIIFLEQRLSKNEQDVSKLSEILPAEPVFSSAIDKNNIGDARCIRMGDGLVFLHIEVSCDADPNVQVIATLPVGFRPFKDLAFVALDRKTGQTTNIHVTSGGKIVARIPSAMQLSINTAFLASNILT